MMKKLSLIFAAILTVFLCINAKAQTTLSFNKFRF